MIFATPEVRDQFHRHVSTKVQHELARFEHSIVNENRTILVKHVNGSEILIQVTDSLVGPVPAER